MRSATIRACRPISPASLAIPGVRETVNIDHIMQGYYSIKALNPLGVVPKPPAHVAALLDAATGSARQ